MTMGRRCIPLALGCALLSLALNARSTEQDADELSKLASSTKELVPGSSQFPEGKENQICDLSKLDFEVLFRQLGYEIDIQEDSFKTKRAVTRTIGLKNRAGKSLRVVIFTGHASSKDAQDMLFCEMGEPARTIHIDFRTLDRGPGDACITLAGPGFNQGSTIRGYLWFYRHSVAVSITCSAEDNLIPIAKAMDDAIKACPLHETSALEKQIPEVTCHEPSSTDNGPREKYRIDYDLSEPLKKGQNIVATSRLSSARVKVFESHIEVTLDSSEKPFTVWVGVFDSSRRWVKWQDDITLPADRKDHR